METLLAGVGDVDEGSHDLVVQQRVPGLRQGFLRPRLDRPADVVGAHRDLLHNAIYRDGGVWLFLRLVGVSSDMEKKVV